MKKRRFFGPALAALLIMVSVLLLCYIYPIKISKWYDNWSDSYTVSGIYHEPKNSIDVLCLGTSINSNAFQPAILWKNAGITSYNLSTEQQSPLVAYYLLQEALKFQSPKVVVISAKWIITEYNNGQDTEEHRNFLDANEGLTHLSLDFMRLSQVKVAAAKDIASQSHQNAWEFLLPFFRYHNDRNITEQNFELSFLNQAHPLKGACIRSRTKELSVIPVGLDTVSETEEKYDFSGMGPAYTAKMIELCKEKGIEVLILEAPTYWNAEMHNKVMAFAKLHNASFLDMNMTSILKESQINWSTDVDIDTHANVLGSYKISTYISQYIKEHYSLNHNTPEMIARTYDDCYDIFMSYYDQFNANSSLLKTNNLADYLGIIKNNPNFVTVISANDEFTPGLTDYEMKALHDLDLKTDFTSNITRWSYLAIMDGGKVAFEQCSPQKVVYNYKMDDAAEISATSAGMATGNPLSKINVGQKDYSLNMRGLNIAVYDKLWGYMVDSVNFDTNNGRNIYRKAGMPDIVYNSPFE